MMKAVRSMLACAGLALPGVLLAGQDILHLPIGDPARKGREVRVTLDGITDTANGDVITPQDMAGRLAGVGILFIGENHTNMDYHDVEFRTIKALHEAGREVLVGLEMFPYTEQAVLTNWNDRRYTEDGFVDLGHWYENWGYHWNYYRNIFLYARDHDIRMYGVNSPRDVVKSVRAKGFDNLSPEVAAHLPPEVAPPTAEYRRLYRASFGPGDTLHTNAEALEGLYRAQTMWDASMGWNALQALKAHGGPKAIMVVLLGAGHVTYGLGAVRQTAPWYDGRIATLVPVNVVDDDGKPVEKVRASYASFVWGLPRELAPLYPGLGVSLMGSLGKEPSQIIRVGKDSPAGRADLKKGDVLLALDGEPVDSEHALRRLMANYRWGDVARVKIRRDGKEVDVAVPIRR